MAALEYIRSSDRITAGTWSLTTGVERTGYLKESLDDGDPSQPLWITGTSIDLRRNFGAAQRVDVVYIHAHTLANAATLHLMMNAADAWGAPTVDITVTIPTPFEDSFTYNLRIDVATAYPTVGDRTKQYLRIVNNVANAVTIAIGEIVMSPTKRTLAALSLQYGLVQQRQRQVAIQSSKRGVRTVYDYGSIERRLKGTFPAPAADLADLLTLETAAKFNASPFVITLDPASATTRYAEPWLVRLAAPISASPINAGQSLVAFEAEELGQGELVGA